MADLFGAIVEGGFGMWRQDRAEGQQDHAQNFSMMEATKSREWQERMSNTAFQRAAADMRAAGINPAMMYGAGHSAAASTPAGATAHGTAGSTPGGNIGLDYTRAALTAQQIRQSEAEIDRIKADAGRIHAEEQEIVARTPTHAVNIERTRQEIAESIERIEKLRQEVRTSASSAAHMDQMVQNLRETIPQIHAQTRQLQVLARLNEAQLKERLTASGLNEAQAAQIHQRLKENLPELERALMNLERQARVMQQPGLAADEAAKDSFVGHLGAYLRALLPIEGLLGAIPLGRSSAPTKPTYTPRTTPGRPGEHR